MHFDVDSNTLFLAVTGSHAYGMARSGSDVDVRGTCLPPWEVRESPFKQFEQFYPEKQMGPWGTGIATQAIAALQKHPTAGASYLFFDGAVDLCIYSLAKFIALAANANPNVLELLFLEDQDVLFADARWNKLREHREMFLSRKCKHTYLGYAHSQLKRIQTHREWLLNPPKKEPMRGDFGLPEESVLPADVRNLIDENVKKTIREWSVADGFDDVIKGAYLDALHERMCEFQATVLQCSEQMLEDRVYELAAVSIGLSRDVLAAIKQERQYRAARKNWTKYQDWKKNRNPGRAALEEKYGFDTKHGAHLVRLMRTGKEILVEGKLRVKRPDAEELLAIRDGFLDYDALMEMTTTLRGEVEAAEKTSTLPRAAQMDAIEQVYLSLLEHP
jgi:predicted nucleotidyltransferase